MLDIVAALVTGALIGGLLVALPDIVTELMHAARARQAGRAVVRGAEQLLRTAAGA